MEYIVVIVVIVFVICFMGYRIKYKHERFQAVKTIPMHDFPFKTGDLIIADGTGFLPAFTRSSVDHAGIIYKHPKTSQLFLWHATIARPAHLVPLYRELERYKLVYVRQLQGDLKKLNPITAKWREGVQKNASFFLEVLLSGLQRFLNPLLNNHVPLPQRNQYYCTILALKTYTAMGVVSPEMNPSHTFLTDDLCSWSQRFPLVFANGFSFGPEIKLICK